MTDSTTDLVRLLTGHFYVIRGRMEDGTPYGSHINLDPEEAAYLAEVIAPEVAARVAEAKIDVLRQMANEIRGSWTGAKCAEVLMEEVAVRERFDPNYRDDTTRGDKA